MDLNYFKSSLMAIFNRINGDSLITFGNTGQLSGDTQETCWISGDEIDRRIAQRLAHQKDAGRSVP